MAKKRIESTIDISKGKGKRRIRATGWAAIILALGLPFAFIIIAYLYFS